MTDEEYDEGLMTRLSKDNPPKRKPIELETYETKEKTTIVTPQEKKTTTTLTETIQTSKQKRQQPSRRTPTQNIGEDITRIIDMINIVNSKIDTLKEAHDNLQTVVYKLIDITQNLRAEYTEHTKHPPKNHQKKVK